MSTNRSRRIDRRTAEQLLGGASASSRPADLEPLGDLLDAASGPAHPGELAGEHTAMAAFRSAQVDPVPQQRRRSMIKTALATLLTAKVAAPAAAAAAVGGITLASATGTLPLPGDSPAEPPVNPAPTSSVPAPTSTPGGHADTPSPSLIGLCQAYTSGADNEHGTATESPAFEVLITEAGGEDNVAAYCGNVLAERPGKPSSLPTQAQDRGQNRGEAPETRPTGAPETVPSETARPGNDDSTTRPTTTQEHPDSQPDDPTATPDNPGSDYSENHGEQATRP
ncbi:hypothetical protein [Haloechinothrix halophila]|uniref:hypothetical protein n=1 Tax=Haloechinothrix halophila TaxID=1069073 RepID=UPI0004197CE7|nr:hypothetical protein [Haloechinothrix halophila]